MCCFITTLMLLGPRFAFVIYWLIYPLKVNLAFNSFILPFLGFIFLPFTTLMYVIIFPMGGWWMWLWLGFAFLADMSMYSGGAYGNRNQIPGYASGK